MRKKTRNDSELLQVLFGASFGPFTLRELSSYGFWPMAHEMRADLAMFLSSLFLLIRGGRWSFDRQFTIGEKGGHR
ncbi:hypothetical protein [Fodinibius roseus]|nr:hypothetical protein [Fodinibius roseus]